MPSKTSPLVVNLGPWAGNLSGLVDKCQTLLPAPTVAMLAEEKSISNLNPFTTKGVDPPGRLLPGPGMSHRFGLRRQQLKQ